MKPFRQAFQPGQIKFQQITGKQKKLPLLIAALVNPEGLPEGVPPRDKLLVPPAISPPKYTISGKQKKLPLLTAALVNPEGLEPPTS